MSVTPCDCVEKLRKFKNEDLYQFVKRMEIPEPGIFGVFGLEVPEEEEVSEALEDLKWKKRK